MIVPFIHEQVWKHMCNCKYGSICVTLPSHSVEQLPQSSSRQIPQAARVSLAEKEAVVDEKKLHARNSP